MASEPVTSAELLLAVEKLERKIDILTKDLQAVTTQVEAMRQWITWLVRLLVGALITLLVTSGVTLLLQQ